MTCVAVPNDGGMDTSTQTAGSFQAPPQSFQQRTGMVPATSQAPAGDDSWVVKQHAARLRGWVRRLVARTGLWSMEDDLWVAAAMALVDAHHRYDASRGVPFEAFAEHRVRGAMLDELRRFDHLPRRLRARAQGVKKARGELRQELGREPTTEELCGHTKMDAATVANVDAVSEAPVALLPEVQHEDHGPGPEVLAQRAEVVSHLAAALEQLPERLRVLMSLHYVEGLPYSDIARIMHVSEPRICQLHAQAIGKVRLKMSHP